MEGALSEAMRLVNMVFQGTVLGPALWNTFFEDVAAVVPQGSQEINLFADDLTVMTSVPKNTSTAVLRQAWVEIQQGAHEWGSSNQVEFDPCKEKL